MQSFSTYEALRPQFEALYRTAYFKIVMKEVSLTKRFLHDCCRLLVWILVLLYNLQHVISVAQARHSADQMVDTLFILLTTLSCLGKQIAFNVRSHRVEQLLAVVDGPTFAAKCSYHVYVQKQNARWMHTLLKIYQGAVIVCGTLWTIFPLVNRVLGEEVRFTGYIPYDTQDITIFVSTVFYMSFLITFQGYANVTLDCTIVSFYALATVQVKMLNYNLEHLFDGGEGRYEGKSFGGEKESRQNRIALLQRRLVNCVEHYGHIARFCKEVESIFGAALFFQFFIMAWVICMTVYKLVGLAPLSAEFISMIMYLICLLMELFMYCYYGMQINNETDGINKSVYFSDWMSANTAFRRQLLVVIEHFRRPITPRIAYVIPMTLDTVVAVLKSAYSLFTFLNRR